jgi:DNA-3-methyladenine glycosylase II
MTADSKTFLTNADPQLANIIATVPEPVVNSTGDVFFDLMSCILEQQIHYRSTKRTFEKMLTVAGLNHLTPENFSIFEEKALPQAKLNISKLETVQRVLDFWTTEQVNWQALTDAAITEKLGSIKGIGKWTIDMILLYTLARPNVFPQDDFHLKEIMVPLYSLNPNSRLTAQMRDVAEAWEGHKSLAVKYLLAWKELKKKIQK